MMCVSELPRGVFTSTYIYVPNLINISFCLVGFPKLSPPRRSSDST